MVSTLTVEEAARIVDEVRARHGLGQKYRLRVEPEGSSRWRVVDPDGKARVVEAMPRDQWQQWLEHYLSGPIFEHDKTTEG